MNAQKQHRLEHQRMADAANKNARRKRRAAAKQARAEAGIKIQWMNFFHGRTWTAPAIIAGILAVLTGPLAPVTFFVVFPLLVVVMLFAAPMECGQCGKRLPTNVTVCKKCGVENA